MSQNEQRKKLELPAAVAGGFRQYRQRFRTFTLFRGILLAVVAVLALVLLAVAADRVFRMTSYGRIALLVIIIGGSLITLAAWGLKPLLRRLHNRRVANRAGRELLEIQDELVSAVDLVAIGDSDTGVSDRLVRDALEDINRKVEKTDFRRTVRYQRLLVPIVAVFAVAAICALIFQGMPVAFENAIQRLFHPMEDIEFYTYTTVRDVSPGDKVVARGRGIVVDTRVNGRVPKSAWVEIEATEADDTGTTTRGRVRIEKNPDDSFSWETGPLVQSVRYRIHAGDAISVWYRLQVEPPPAVDRKSAEISYPEYTSLAMSRIDPLEGGLELVKGGSFQLRIRSGTAVSAVLTSGDVARELEAEGDGGFVSGVLVADRDTAYTVSLTDKFGLKSPEADVISVTVVPDPLPDVSIDEPGRNLVVMAHETIAIAATATDNFGLRKLFLSWHRLTGEAQDTWQNIALASGGVTARQLNGRIVFDLAKTDVKPGGGIEYRAQASDFAGPVDMRTARSDTYSISVVDPDVFVNNVLSAVDKLRMDILRLAQAERSEAEISTGLAARDDVLIAERSTTDALIAGSSRQGGIGERTEDIITRAAALRDELIRVPTISVDVVMVMKNAVPLLVTVREKDMRQAEKWLRRSADTEAGDVRREHIEEGARDQVTAADKLEAIAFMLGKITRQGKLKGLAELAKSLAEQQREIAKDTQVLMPETLAKDAEELSEDEWEKLNNLAEAQEDVATGIADLEKNLKASASELAFDDPALSMKASAAAAQMGSEGIGAKSEYALSIISLNQLMNAGEPMEQIVMTLDDVADLLDDDDPMEIKDMASVVKALIEYVARQTQIITDINWRRDMHAKAVPIADTAKAQSLLRRDVKEQATALQFLAMQLEGYDSATVTSLRDAARAMREAAVALRAEDDVTALPPAELALDLLLGSRVALEMEMGELEEAEMMGGVPKSKVMLAKILNEQKIVNADTRRVETMFASMDARVFSRATGKIARHQARVRRSMSGFVPKQTTYLSGKGAMMKQISDLMLLSATALDEADTGRETRIVQLQIVALMEAQFLGGGGNMEGMGVNMGGGMMISKMRAFGLGMPAGGSMGGGNRNVPKSDLNLGNDEWNVIRSKYEGRIVTGWEDVAAPEFRGLLETYFDGIREMDK